MRIAAIGAGDNGAVPVKLSCFELMAGDRPLPEKFAMVAEAGLDGYCGLECSGSFTVDDLADSVRWVRSQ